jgi:ABC-type lipoprotein export system ATPase subunit
MNTLVDVQGLQKEYICGKTRLQALCSVDLTVSPGEYLTIMGTSGSGKSTLLHIMGCLDTPTDGTYHLNGEDISNLSDSALSHIRSRKIGIVFQTFNLISEYNVLENVSLPLLYQGIAEAEAKERARDCLSMVGLEHRIRHRPKELSGGEMQRTAIARALVINPWLMLADEPTGNLDSATGKDILSLFGDLHMKGATIVMVTHDPHVAAVSQRTLQMKDGCLL